jgi:adenylosuccinate lyase
LRINISLCPVWAYTHFQPAQPTTVGKRAAMWIEDLLLDLEQLDFQLKSIRFFGCKDTTGTARKLYDAVLTAIWKRRHGSSC